MTPLEYLRRRRGTPLTPPQRQLFLEVCETVDAGIRAAREPAPAAEELLRCPCAVIYSRCHNPAHAQTGARA